MKKTLTEQEHLARVLLDTVDRHRHHVGSHLREDLVLLHDAEKLAKEVLDANENRSNRA